ncbi:MAG: lytic transglycosylase domain-containing protein, partial [Actinomycetota bacterium]|nr:lytic transglycosylase domain-containing protein [Actinomycetota bacterium]
VVSSGTYAEALEELSDAREVLENAEAAIAHGQMTIPDLELALDRISTAIPRLRSRLAAASDVHADASTDLDQLLALRYTLGASRPPLIMFQAREAFELDRRLETVLSAAESERLSAIQISHNVRDDATLQLRDAREGVEQVRVLLELRRDEFGLAMADAEAVDGTLDDLEAAASIERRLGVVQNTDLTFVALEAYVTAAATTREAHVTCGLDWPVLAAIGRVESRHGTYGDSELDVAGETLVDIVGIPLDGTRNTREIRDTDGGLLDGDPVYDRAVGPMQFIPTTWARWARDGDGDGVADPHNLYDAASAAGAYLCAAGNFISTDGTRRAIFAYNHSDAYVDAVLQLVDVYRASGIDTE